MGTALDEIAKRGCRAFVPERLRDWHRFQLRQCRIDAITILRRVEHSETFRGSCTMEPRNFRQTVASSAGCRKS
jgi:hypothetical protein